MEQEVKAPQAIEWVCRMHSQVVRDRPGNCAICGMALEPKGTDADHAKPELRVKGSE